MPLPPHDPFTVHDDYINHISLQTELKDLVPLLTLIILYEGTVNPRKRTLLCRMQR